MSDLPISPAFTEATSFRPLRHKLISQAMLQALPLAIMVSSGFHIIHTTLTGLLPDPKNIALFTALLWSVSSLYLAAVNGRTLSKVRQQFDHLSQHDRQTGLLNRSAWLVGLTHLMAESRQDGRWLAVIAIGLDQVRSIAEALGPAAADRLIHENATRLSALGRQTDFLAHLGDGEFMLAIGNLEEVRHVATIAEQIVQTLDQTTEHQGHWLHGSPVAGVALFHGKDGAEIAAERLLGQARHALDAARQAGGRRFHFYDERLGERVRHRVDMENSLRIALEQGALSVCYQPIFKCDSADRYTLAGFEALARWPTPEGSISPDIFIELAEETGLINDLGAWVLDQAAGQLAQWRQNYPGAHHLSISVNVSTRQIEESRFPEIVAAILERHCLPAPSLILELTESLYANPGEQLLNTLSKLRNMGIRLAMDDFGTGYSALSNLTHLPLDRLKIDKSFVRNLPMTGEPHDHHSRESAVIRTILAIAAELGLEVVAEGVEYPAQAAHLVHHRCTLFQGWLFGRPTPAVDLAHLFESNESKDITLPFSPTIPTLPLPSPA